MKGSSRVQDCVIGSGAGGAVLAMRLAQAGRSVLVLEEGPEVDKSKFTQREGAMYALLYREGGQQTTTDGGISVLQGRCLGGSTTINQGDCVPMEPSILDHWRQGFGWDSLGLDNAGFAALADRAMREVGANPIPDELINRNNRLLAEGAAKLGIAGTNLQHNRTGCIGSGYCLIGCAYDAKKGTILSHLPAARAAGADIWCDSMVMRIDTRNGLRVLGTDFEVSAERVFVCAGAIHTPAILNRSAIKPAGLGRNLSLQPQAPLVAFFDERVEFHRGIPQSWGTTSTLSVDAERGLGGYSIEGISAGPAMTASLIPGDMAELKPLLNLYPHVAASLCLVPDRPGGSLSFPKYGRPKIKYTPSDDHTARLREAMKTAARIYLAAGAREVAVPATDGPRIKLDSDVGLIDDMPLRSCELPLISAHPQGSMRMGPGRDAPVDLEFQVKGAPGVFVCDASLFPTTSSTHTMIPVMTLAHLLADQLGA